MRPSRNPGPPSGYHLGRLQWPLSQEGERGMCPRVLPNARKRHLRSRELGLDESSSMCSCVLLGASQTPLGTGVCMRAVGLRLPSGIAVELQGASELQLGSSQAPLSW